MLDIKLVGSSIECKFTFRLKVKMKFNLKRLNDDDGGDYHDDSLVSSSCSRVILSLRPEGNRYSYIYKSRWLSIVVTGKQQVDWYKSERKERAFCLLCSLVFVWVRGNWPGKRCLVDIHIWTKIKPLGQLLFKLPVLKQQQVELSLACQQSVILFLFSLGSLALHYIGQLFRL